MNIVYFLQNFPKVSETFILNEIAELEKKGHKVAVFALNNTEEKVLHEEFQDLDAEIYYPDFPSYSDFDSLIWSKTIHPSFLRTLNLNKGLKNRLVQTYMTKQLINFLERIDFDPDIIQTHFPTRSKLPAYSASKILDVPFTVETHAYEIFREDKKHFSKKLLSRSDRIITVSEYNKNYLKKEFGLEKPIDVVPVSIDTEKFKPQGLEEKNKIVSVGRLVEKKGFKYGIKAFAQLKEEHSELQYNIIGKGELEQDLKQLAKDLEIEEDVNFLGHVSDEELKREMEEAKAFVLPCVKAENGDLDAMPMVLKEAMALKTPCVSTTVSAIPELIEPEEDGLLAEPRNSEALSEKLSELLQSKGGRHKIGVKARQKIIESFDISENVEEIEGSFHKALR